MHYYVKMWSLQKNLCKLSLWRRIFYFRDKISAHVQISPDQINVKIKPKTKRTENEWSRLIFIWVKHKFFSLRQVFCSIFYTMQSQMKWKQTAHQKLSRLKPVNSRLFSFRSFVRLDNDISWQGHDRKWKAWSVRDYNSISSIDASKAFISALCSQSNNVYLVIILDPFCDDSRQHSMLLNNPKTHFLHHASHHDLTFKF